MVERKKLEESFAQVLNQATPDDLESLDRVFQGLKAKQNNEARTYINGLLNYDGKMVSDDTLEAKITLNPLLLNPLKIVHGGITATFADSAMGHLIYEIISETEACVTTEIKINYLKPAIGRTLTCLAKLIHKGSHIFVVQADIFDEDDIQIALSTASFFIIPRPK